jgi:branched-subunit amino acid transport protein
VVPVRFVLKFAGLAMPKRWFDATHARRAIELKPIALLTALVVVQSIASGRHDDVDAARSAGVVVGALAVWRRAPFILVVVSAAVTVAVWRAVSG